MVTIAQYVRNEVQQKPFLQEALSRGVINNAALAESFIPEIEKMMKKKVKFSAVNMAIRRLEEDLKKVSSKPIKFGKEADITIKSNLIAFSVKRTWDTQKNLKEVYCLSEGHPGNFLTVTQGPHEIMIITSEIYLPKLNSLFPANSVQKIMKNLCGLTIKLPDDSLETVGFTYIISRALAWENINIVDLVSTYTELTLFVDENDSSKAFSILRELVKKNS